MTAQRSSTRSARQRRRLPDALAEGAGPTPARGHGPGGMGLGAWAWGHGPGGMGLRAPACRRGPAGTDLRAPICRHRSAARTQGIGVLWHRSVGTDLPAPTHKHGPPSSDPGRRPNWAPSSLAKAWAPWSGRASIWRERLAGAAGDGSVGEVGGEVGEGEAGGVGGHRYQAGGGQAGAGVDLEDAACARGVEDGVDSGDVAAT